MLGNNPVICVVGLGYVGLPLAAAFGRTGWKTYGFDINPERVRTLNAGTDWTRELSEKQLQETTIEYSDDPAVIGKADIVIVAVPTPVHDDTTPDLTPLLKASETVGRNLKKGAIVAYESTVYPGATEEECVPILESESGLACGKDFTVGYSPERINPGDKEHTIDKIVKVVAGQDEATLDTLAKAYGKIVPAGIHRAASIKAAELAKALENTQRDINIALMNEVARLCAKLGIRTKDVLSAAGTKWNFLPFSPGLVGGHCIGVDPYYLVHKAKQLGMETEVIAAGRQVNDSMAGFVTTRLIEALKASDKSQNGVSVLVLGLTFKENIPDTRNAKIHDVIKGLKGAGVDVRCHDSELSDEDIKGLGFTPGGLEDGPFDAILAAVPHRAELTVPSTTLIAALKKGGVFFDLKSVRSPVDFDAAGITYLSL